ncbi:uncharacterized protein EAE97_001943 [Botrytis byssoidea]|uniref:Yippee domain-containing protein n=1 Tax=Botrytis byssoidea TaxID=139641 RepID=A0A9P5IST7_9HELO|nr:uncharacterized protein EAE97_001943 [Botrytis byssoidea]KAF7952446.1 hypothetical protein EAE97_001943 [Botrytis byssoidea]
MSNERLTFPTYLLPSFSFPFRRRTSSPPSTKTASLNTSTSANPLVPGLSYSSTSSCNETPLASPTSGSFLSRVPTTSTHKSESWSDIENENESHDVTYAPTSPPRTKFLPQPHLSRPFPSTIRCLTCSTHISYSSQIISKGFTGRHGRAYLVAPPPSSPVPQIPPFPPTAHDRSRNISNVRVGRPSNRELLTGHHVVADVNCAVCNTLLGWKYVDAREAGQRYKIGKFILETKRVGVVETFEDEDVRTHSLDFRREDDNSSGFMGVGMGNPGKFEGARKDGELHTWNVETKEEEEAKGWVNFDSENEDECEELFAGIWDAEVAQKRRIRRIDRRRKEVERERLASKDSGVGGL